MGGAWGRAKPLSGFRDFGQNSPGSSSGLFQPFACLLAPGLFLGSQELVFSRPLSRFQQTGGRSDLIQRVVHLVARVQLDSLGEAWISLHKLEEDRTLRGVEVDRLVGVVDLDRGLLDVLGGHESMRCGKKRDREGASGVSQVSQAGGGHQRRLLGRRFEPQPETHPQAAGRPVQGW